MFDSAIYTRRREGLRNKLSSGILFFPGNTEASFNYPANPYHFRQDSNFLYFFGLDHPDLCGLIDLDTGEDWIFGNDVDMDDIIWMGNQPFLKDRATEVGISNTAPYKDLEAVLSKAKSQGREVMILPPYRGETKMEIERLTGVNSHDVKSLVSEEFIKAVVSLRSVKDHNEVAEIIKAVDTAYLMHTTSMKMAMPGVVEQEIAGAIEGISLANGGPISFPVILSMDGQTLHNHYHGNTLEAGRMMVTDAGAESALHYASDITRTVPVGGKFDARQRSIYEIVLAANVKATEAMKPGVSFRDCHFVAAKTIASGLKDIGLMKGDVDEAVAQGAHALFFPHGLGHMMGLDVHDMEGLGENYVGYNDEIQRSKQFGLAFLRMGRKLEKGFVMTVEPGCYFIPALIDQWKAENKFKDFINFDNVETFKDFGGIRIEDDILVTETGWELLGKPIPKTVADIEDVMR
ncbi:MAG: aminopeptidase P family protein [Bacteroidales bacterium]|nr:aminopeptidase P family protein [Bacteroidales bacterium]